ncbi:MAG: DNA-binding response regulator [Acidimicrobiia bacterium]
MAPNGGELRVVLGSSSTLLLDSLRACLIAAGALVVGETRRCVLLEALCRSERPDVVVCETDLGDGTPAVATLGGLDASVVILTRQPNVREARQVLGAGASAYLCLEASAHLLLEAIRVGCSGGIIVDPWLARSLLNEAFAAAAESVRAPLSAREMALLAAMSEALSTVELARKFGLSPKTVESHKTRIFAKLDARNQAHAVAIAFEQGLLAAPS